MSKRAVDDAVHGGADVAYVGDVAADSAGVGGQDQRADERSTGVMIYTNRREWLIASVSDGRPAWDDGTENPEYFGLAKTEHQFREALCEAAFPTVRKLEKRRMQTLMAEELKAMGAE